jgi:hypothetical protein
MFAGNVGGLYGKKETDIHSAKVRESRKGTHDPKTTHFRDRLALIR